MDEKLQKLLSRPEWGKKQREFLSRPENFELAVVAEKYISSLDEQIKFLLEKKRLHKQRHPIFYFFKEEVLQKIKAFIG